MNNIKKILMVVSNSCSHCNGQGYIEIRDCSGEVQVEETCSWCGGTGTTDTEHQDHQEAK